MKEDSKRLTGDPKLDSIGFTVADLNDPKYDLIGDEIVDLVFLHSGQVDSYDQLLQYEEDLDGDEPHKELYLGLLKSHRAYGEMFLESALKVYSKMITKDPLTEEWRNIVG